jgi:prepilin-type N-terminal cleavage/methylation domain-containing protein
MRSLKLFRKNHGGFTLLEIAVVMVIIGILAGGSMSLMKVLTERKSRNESAGYLQQVRSTLIGFAENNGRLPWADGNADGVEDNGVTLGGLPFQTLQITPVDSYTRVLRYEVNSQLTTSRTVTCAALQAGLTGRPAVVDADGSPISFPVAFVLVSAGPMDADNNGNVFDGMNTGTHQGNNANGTPNYLRSPPLTGNFDDLTAYMGGNELFVDLCEYLTLAVNNNSATTTVYVFNVNLGSDMGSISAGSSALYTILSGSQIVIYDGPNGPSGPGGIVSPTTPQTPVILAGQDATINIP